MTDEGYLKSHIGARIKSLREELSLSCDDLARQAQMDAKHLEDIEANKVLPAIGDLVQLSNILQTTIGTFFQTHLPEKRVELVKADQRWNVANGDQLFDPHYYKYQALSYQLTDKLMAPFYVEIAPGKTETADSCHKGEEFLYVLNGQLKACIDGKEYLMSKGDSIYFDSRLKHSLHAIGAENVTLLAIVANSHKNRTEDTIERAFDKR